LVIAITVDAYSRGSQTGLIEHPVTSACRTREQAPADPGITRPAPAEGGGIMTLQLLLSWWNLIYLVPLALALIYLVIYMATGMSFGDGDADVHMDVEADADADADVDADADADTDADADADHDLAGEHEAGHEPQHETSTSGGFSLLTLLGVGRAPISVLLMVFLLIWSVTGIIANRIIYGLSESVPPTVIISVPLAMLLSLFGTAGLARLIGRSMPNSETYVRRKSSLVGLLGEAVYDMTTGFGTVQVRDESGDLHELPCETQGEANSKKMIHKGQRVVLYDYNEEKGVFYVTPFEPEKQ
jgi:membrane protein implicated in regulation of membrane protease activity